MFLKSLFFYQFKRRFFLLIGTPFILSACGTFSETYSYEPMNRQTERRMKIANYIQTQFIDSETYINIDFGNEYIIKPDSFKPLDSLYKIKYEESHFGGMSRARELEIGSQIDSVLLRVLKDTALFKYEINHIFALKKQDSITCISATFLMNAQDSIEKVNIAFQLTDHKKYLPYLIEFLKKQSFLFDQYDPSEEENKLYEFFEAELTKKNGALRKGNFIAHILHVMNAANVQQTLSTEPIIKQLIVDLVTKYVSSYQSIAWSKVTTELDENNQLLGYVVQHEWKYEDSKGKTYHLLRQFTLNSYFQVINIASIDGIDTSL